MSPSAADRKLRRRDHRQSQPIANSSGASAAAPYASTTRRGRPRVGSRLNRHPAARLVASATGATVVTHESITDPEARLYKKGDGQPAKLCYMGHALMENRNGLAVRGGISQATGTAEREDALVLVDHHRGRNKRRITLGADKAYDVAQFVQDLKDRSVTPHIAIDGHLTKTGKARKTAIDGRTLRHAGYAISLRCRKRIEEVFGWIKSSAGLRKVKLRGRARVDAIFTMALAAYNLIRLPKLLGAVA